jgi:hypothetical protein
MKLLAMVTDPKSIRRYLAPVGGRPTPARSPTRRSPFWKSVVRRQKMLEGADLARLRCLHRDIAMPGRGRYALIRSLRLRLRAAAEE